MKKQRRQTRGGEREGGGVVEAVEAVENEEEVEKEEEKKEGNKCWIREFLTWVTLNLFYSKI